MAPMEQTPAPSERPDPWALPDVDDLTIAVVGGTGEQGRGLATRWAQAGHRVIIGSRNVERARTAAEEIGHDVVGADNAAAAVQADVVVIAVPYAGHADTVAEISAELDGKVVIDCVNPLGFDKQGAFALEVPEGSAAQQAAALAPNATVVGAFHHVSAVLLLDAEIARIEADVLVVGDDRQATDTVQALAQRIPGFRGVYAGRLRNAGQVEAMTANLISMNRRYRGHAGLRVTDV